MRKQEKSYIWELAHVRARFLLWILLRLTTIAWMGKWAVTIWAAPFCLRVAPIALWPALKRIRRVIAFLCAQFRLISTLQFGCH